MKSLLKNKKMVSRVLFLGGLTLTAFVFLNILISSLLFIIHVGISAVTPVVSLVLSLGLLLFLWKKSSQQQNLIPVLVILLVVLAIIIGSIAVSGKILDYTYDGNSYQKNIIGKLRDGWNPVYENIEDFDSESDLCFGMTSENSLWENHYAKATHYYAACIYKLTGNIETGKSVNLISLAALILIVAAYFLYQDKHVIFTILFCVVIMTYPVFVVQLFTNYIDLLLGIYLFLLIFCFLLFEEDAFFDGYTERFLLFMMVLSIMINIKFSSFAYAGIFSLGYYIWYICRMVRKRLERRWFVNFTAVAVVSVLVGVFVIGLSVYPRNMLEHGNPFYPLFGEDSVDIMTINSPAAFSTLSPLERFFTALFSKAANMVYVDGATPEFKLPFTYTENEYQILYCADLRISGHGVLFSGIFIASVILMAVSFSHLKKYNQKLLVLTAIPVFVLILMVCTMEDVWWARYFPQLFLIPLFVLLQLDEFKNNYSRMAIVGLFVALLANNALTVRSTYDFYDGYIYNTNEQYEVFDTAIQSAEGTLILATDSFKGSIYNAVDRLPEDVKVVIEPVDIPQNETSYGYIINGRLAWRFAEE